MSAPTIPTAAVSPALNRGPIGLVFCCTLIGAVAQVFLKFGLAGMHFTPSLATLLAVLSNFQLMLGLALYGVNTALLILALRKGELSVLYPVIALTYVWVTILSVMIFHETVNVFKILGLATVVLGVTVLGRRG